MYKVKFTILAIFKHRLKWSSAHLYGYATIPSIHLQNFVILKHVKH